jgi:uncharacterized DUF497 family protein
MDGEYDWDPVKAWKNLLRHGVSFEEARTAFRDPLGIVVGDPRHSFEEARYVLLALSAQHHLVSVMFTERGPVIRIISARRVTAAERREYEEATR